MTFSIVIPSFNGEKFLESTILSALNQTRCPDEIIVYDDNSSDKTAEICEKFKSKIIYILNADGPSGFVNSWNNCIALAKSKYISILHQDDLLYPTFLEESERLFKENPNVLHIFSGCDYINENNEIIISFDNEFCSEDSLSYKIYNGNEYISAYQKKYGALVHVHRCPGVVTNRSVFFDKNIFYNEAAGHIADDDFFYRVSFATSVIGILKPLASYRIHANSETSSIGELKLVQRLSNDYLFQIKQWMGNSEINKENKLYFRNQFFKYNKRLLGYSMKKMSFDTTKNVIRNYIRYLFLK